MDFGNVGQKIDDKELLLLKSMWKAGFGDDDAFIDYFFSRYDSESTRFLYRNVHREPVAQMHAFEFVDDFCKKKGCYIYGVTTLPESRGQGIAANLLKSALLMLKEQGVEYAVLIAEEPSLQVWYESLGFKKFSQVIDVVGIDDDMNFGMEDKTLNHGMYYFFNDVITQLTHKIKIKSIY